MRGMSTPAEILSAFAAAPLLIPAHLSCGRGAASHLPVRPRRPGEGFRYVQYTCPDCLARTCSLIEGGAEAGDEITAGCIWCAAVCTVRVRRAVFA
jgi:hypothetical protein